MYKLNIYQKILAHARVGIETGRYAFICNAVRGASGAYDYIDLVPGDFDLIELERAGEHIIDKIRAGLTVERDVALHTLGEWLDWHKVESLPAHKFEGMDNTLILCRLAWIDKMIEEYSIEDARSCPAPK